MANSRKNNKKTKTTTKKKMAKPVREVAKIKVDVKGKPERHTGRHFVIAAGLILLPLVVGIVSSLITGDAMMGFGQFNQPPLAPPAWLFPVAWTILYILMGVASYLIYRLNPKTESEQKLQKAEIIIYFVQLFFNFMWTLIFFALEARWFALGWLIVMWLMILVLICMCKKNCKAAAWCLVPYILWCTFATYLNVMIAILN